MSQLNAVAVECTKSINESRAEIFAELNLKNRGGLVWDSLPESARKVLCRASGLKTGHINLPINKFSELDRAQLIRSIRSIGAIAQEIKQLSCFSLQDFK